MRLLCLLKKITSKSELLQDINVLIWNELQYQLDHFPVKEVGSGLEIGEQHSAPSLFYPIYWIQTLGFIGCQRILKGHTVMNQNATIC